MSEFMEAMNRLDLITNEIGKIRRALEATRDGRPFDEAFCEEVIMEASESSLRNWMIKMICHILERGYSSRKEEYSGWESEIEEFQEHITTEVSWDKFQREKKRQKGNKHDTGPISYLRRNLKDFWEEGIDLYTRRAKRYRDLPDITDLLSIDIPWSLEDLLDDDIGNLLKKLPDLKD